MWKKLLAVSMVVLSTNSSAVSLWLKCSTRGDDDQKVDIKYYGLVDSETLFYYSTESSSLQGPPLKAEGDYFARIREITEYSSFVATSKTKIYRTSLKYEEFIDYRWRNGRSEYVAIRGTCEKISQPPNYKERQF